MPHAQYAGIDLGSNSFHMVLARLLPNGRLQVVDRHKEYVRLAGGLGADNQLSPEVMERALGCLARFSDRLTEVPPQNVRCVATNTFRKARNADELLALSEAALGHPIEIVSGLEEARLIYRGVGLDFDQPGKRLVVDIGGGSTELILGDAEGPHALDSMYMGCVGWTQRFFPDGALTKERFEAAVRSTRRKLGHRVRRYRHQATHFVGSSGTILAISRLLTERPESGGTITLDGLKWLTKKLCAAGHVDALQGGGMSQQRSQVLPGGLAILHGVVRALQIDQLTAVDTALREGLLVELLGRERDGDRREMTVAELESRFGIDTIHGRRVAALAMRLFDQVADAWGFSTAERSLLNWASRLHEVGLFMGFSGYHKHGAYMLHHTDMSGFSLQDQRALAAITLCHRGKFSQSRLTRFELSNAVSLRLILLLRIAVRLNRRRSPTPLPEIAARAEGDTLSLTFPSGWLAERPLTQDDLNSEVQDCAGIGVSVLVS